MITILFENLISAIWVGNAVLHMKGNM